MRQPQGRPDGDVDCETPTVKGRVWLMKVRRASPLVLMATILAASLAWLALAAEGATLTDIEQNWAKGAIHRLVENGVVNGYPDRTFRPDRDVTRGEFAKMMVAAFDLAPGSGHPFRDVTGGWAAPYAAALEQSGIIQGFPDKTFRPKLPITHAEAVQMIVRALGAANVKGFPSSEATPTFKDIPRPHWAFSAAELAAQLGILPPYNVTRLVPDEPATRAETAYMIDAAQSLTVVRGTVSQVQTDPARIEVEKSNGGTTPVTVPKAPTDAAGRSVGRAPVFLRNTILTDVGQVKVGDGIYALIDKHGQPRLVDVRGEITQDDVVQKVAGYTRGLLTPQVLKAIIAGNWSVVGNGLKGTLYNEMLKLGATPLEAESIMRQDWASMKGLARERLAGALGAYLGISNDLSSALLNQDWPTAKELAQTEAVEELLNLFLFSGGAGQNVSPAGAATS